MQATRLRTIALIALALTALPLGVAACGDDDESGGQTATAAATTQLAPIKDYLLAHTQRLSAETARLNALSEQYYELAKSVDFDYAKLLSEHRAEVERLVQQMQAAFRRANPAYEEMEGVVAGVPELADYDVILDAGADGSDPENAVPFSLKTPAGKVYRQPGNFFFLTESSLWGTEPKFAATGVKTTDLDGDGKASFGEAVPNADFLVTATRDFKKYADELDVSAKRWQPTKQDAFNALVVMTPTMSEYFEAWKNSRFVAGEDAKEKGFVAASRLQDIADILGGLVLVYDSVEPDVRQASGAQAAQTGTSLKGLYDFAVKLREQEAAGKQFTAEQADTLGSEAQTRAEAIAGQVSQAAGKLNIELES